MSAENPYAPIKVRRAPVYGWWLAGAAAIALAAVAATPFGGWIQSFFWGSGARWQDAYIALEAADIMQSGNPAERERMLLANAMVDGEPPPGMKIGPRIHPRGTLARLRYETLDENGELMDEWQVRALVPGIGNGNGPFWRSPCGRPCEDESSRGDVTRVLRSGEAGIAEEWVLRMPVGRTFEFKGASLQTHDILDDKPRSVPVTSVMVDGKSIARPAKIRVTLLEVCAGTVRAGTALDLRFAENAVVPVPLGFRTSRWVQLDRCGRLAQLPPPRPPEAAPLQVARQPVIAVTAPNAIVVRADTPGGYARLTIDEGWLDRHNTPVVADLITLCRYDAAANRWQRLPAPDPRVSWRMVPRKVVGGEGPARVVFELPREVALFWVQWSEVTEINRGGVLPQLRDAMVFSGPVRCNDLHLPPATNGDAAVCVPFANRAEARLVAAPAVACRQ